MAFTSEQQAVQLMERAKQILVIAREHPTLDSISSAIAIGLVLKKLGKTFDVVVPGLNEKNYPNFLPKLRIRPEPGAMRAFHIKLDVSKAPLSELMYDVKDGELNMTLVPKYGEWEKSDVCIEHGSDRYDLIIAVDTADMKSLGANFAQHADFLYRTNIINIDHSATNEHWGQVNLIDLNAVSTTEAVYHFLKTCPAHRDPASQGPAYRDPASREKLEFISPDVATCLLSGMIAKTKSFRTKNVTPKTLRVSSELLEKGARRDEIVKKLWRVQNVSGLKLWGRVLSRLEHDIDSGLVWSSISEQDLVETGANVESLEALIDDVLAYAPEAKVVVFFTPHAEGLGVAIHAVPPVSASDLARIFGATGTQERAMFVFKDEGSMPERVQKVLERVRLTVGKHR